MEKQYIRAICVLIIGNWVFWFAGNLLNMIRIWPDLTVGVIQHLALSVGIIGVCLYGLYSGTPKLSTALIPLSYFMGIGMLVLAVFHWF